MRSQHTRLDLSRSALLPKLPWVVEHTRLEACNEELNGLLRHLLEDGLEFFVFAVERRELARRTFLAGWRIVCANRIPSGEARAVLVFGIPDWKGHCYLLRVGKSQ